MDADYPHTCLDPGQRVLLRYRNTILRTYANRGPLSSISAISFAPDVDLLEDPNPWCASIRVFQHPCRLSSEETNPYFFSRMGHRPPASRGHRAIESHETRGSRTRV